MSARLLQEYESNRTKAGNKPTRNSSDQAIKADGQTKSKLRCFYCNKVGHKKAQCWKRKRNEKEKGEHSEQGGAKDSALMARTRDVLHGRGRNRNRILRS